MIAVKPFVFNGYHELETIYAISAAVTRSKETEPVVDEIIALARAAFVFDNVVLYLRQDSDPESSQLEPLYARAVGRGRSTEGDLAWGETTANLAIQSGQAVIREEINEAIPSERMKQRHVLGVPLRMGDKIFGTLVFVRYGGPLFTADHLPLAEFVTDQIAQMLERERLVKRLTSLEAERQIERLQDNFVATISHEFRTPLGFIKGYATSLLRDDISWDEQTRREFLTIIDEEADRLRELIDNLLDSSRLQSGTLRMEFQSVRLAALLRDMALRASSLHENMIVELDIRDNDIEVQADPTRLAQVFDNLFSNAAKYAPGSKTLLSLTAEDHEAHIIVRDYGEGIPPEHLNKLFTRFYRVPDQPAAVRGSGLGLFICRWIIRAHGGEIVAESTPGHGAVFHIYLPCIQLSGG